jgi:hypothetical protein
MYASPSSHGTSIKRQKLTIRSLSTHSGSATCDCAAHRAASTGIGSERKQTALAVLFPILVCAFCPACLPLWAPLLASLGLGFALPEALHPVAIAAAVLIAMLPAGARALRLRTWWPVLIVAVGGTLFLASHAAPSGQIAEVCGALFLVTSSLLERRISAAWVSGTRT